MLELARARFNPVVFIGFLKRIARLPLRWFHRPGTAVGCLMYWCSPTYARRLGVNLRASGICATDREYRALLNEAVRETGKTATESIKVWFAPHADINGLCVDCRGWNLAEEARRLGKGMIFLLPHLGSFQFAMRYIAQRVPLTALYRPPRQRWREPYMMAGSRHARLSMAATDLKGVERLIQALSRGEAVVLPPDQAPNSRGGVWADFFGRPAYTTTLPKKLQRATGAALIAVFAERLPHGQGFRMELQSVPTAGFSEAVLNRAVETLVRCCPGQYLWSYNRYKIPRAARRRKKAFSETS